MIYLIHWVQDLFDNSCGVTMVGMQQKRNWRGMSDYAAYGVSMMYRYMYLIVLLPAWRM